MRKGDNEEKIRWLQATLNQYEGRLLRYLKRMVPEQFARDVVQDAFVKLWQEDPERLKGHEAPWLFRVCRNRALDILKKEGRMSPLIQIKARHQTILWRRWKESRRQLACYK